MSVAPGRPGDSRRLSVVRAHGPPKQQRAASHLAMSNRVIPFFVFGADLLRFSNVGSFPQKRPPADTRLCHACSLTSRRRDSSNSVPPMRGDGAPTGALFFRSRLRRATPCPGATGTSLGAPPWRFSDADPRSRLPAVGHRSRSDCPRQAVTAWRSGSGPPYVAVRAASAGRHSLLRLSGSFLENAPHERGWESLYYKFVT